MTTERWIIVALLSFLMGSAANTANKPGLQAEGTLIPGNLVIVGTTPNDLKDGGPPASKSLTIGDPVVNSNNLMCLTVDSAGKLAQVNCLLAH